VFACTFVLYIKKLTLDTNTINKECNFTERRMMVYLPCDAQIITLQFHERMIRSH